MNAVGSPPVPKRAAKKTQAQIRAEQEAALQAASQAMINGIVNLTPGDASPLDKLLACRDLLDYREAATLLAIKVDTVRRMVYNRNQAEEAGRAPDEMCFPQPTISKGVKTRLWAVSAVVDWAAKNRRLHVDEHGRPRFVKRSPSGRPPGGGAESG